MPICGGNGRVLLDRVSAAGQRRVRGRDEIGAGIERDRGAVNLQLVEAGVVDVDVVEPPDVLRAGPVDLGQPLPGGGGIDVLDPISQMSSLL